MGNKFINKIMKFMYGRNGFDYASKWLSWIYIFALSISFILDLFSGSSNVAWVISIVFWGIATLLLILIVFRTLSKDIPKRRIENEFCYRQRDKWKQAKALYNTKKKDKDHVYKKCPKCGKVLRFKRIKGKKTINCPYCNTEVTVHIHKTSKNN